MEDVFVPECQDGFDFDSVDRFLSEGKRVWALVPMSSDPVLVGHKVREMLKGREFRIYSGRNRDSRRFARQLDSALEEDPSGWILSDLLDSDEGTASRLKCAEALSQRFVHLTLPLHLCITRVG